MSLSRITLLHVVGNKTRKIAMKSKQTSAMWVEGARNFETRRQCSTSPCYCVVWVLRPSINKPRTCTDEISRLETELSCFAYFGTMLVEETWFVDTWQFELTVCMFVTVRVTSFDANVKIKLPFKNCSTWEELSGSFSYPGTCGTDVSAPSNAGHIWLSWFSSVCPGYTAIVPKTRQLPLSFLFVTVHYS
jgi:hypothetical protein